MKYFLFKKCLCGVLVCVVFASCIKKGAFDFSNTSLKMDGTWGITLVNSETSFTDFTIDSAITIVSDNNVLKVIYSAEMISSGKIKDLYPAVDYKWDFSLTDIQEPATVPYTDTVIFSGPQDILFYGDTDKILIDTAVFTKGTFRLVVNNSIDHDVIFKIRSPYFKDKNGKTLDRTDTIKHNAHNFSINIDLTGARVKLRRNSLPCEIDIIAYNDGHPFLGAKKHMDIDVYGRFYVFKFIEGHAISYDTTINETLDFTIGNENRMAFWVKNIKGGQIRLNTFNSFGAGMTFTADTCEFTANNDSPINLLKNTNSVYPIKPATYNAQGKESFTIPLSNFAIANNNKFRFVGSVVANEQGMTGPVVWARDTSSCAIQASLEIPLDLNLNYFIYRDTIAQDMSGIALPDTYKNLTFRVGIENDFPIQLNAQLYFLDKNYRVVDSLFSQPTLISAAKTNSADGKTLVPGNLNPNPSFIEISDARLGNLNKARYLYVNAKATSNNQQVIVRSDQKLKVKVGVKTTVKTNNSK